MDDNGWAGQAAAPSRRRFLIRLAGWLLSLAALAVAGLSLRFLLPGRRVRRPPLLVPALDAEELPARGVKRLDLSLPAASGRRPLEQRVFVVRRGDALFALSARCTHLGCLVEWSRRRERFVCPCHGGLYDAEGRVVQGPPPGPLERIPVFVRQGKVYLELEGGAE